MVLKSRSTSTHWPVHCLRGIINPSSVREFSVQAGFRAGSYYRGAWKSIFGNIISGQRWRLAMSKGYLWKTKHQQMRVESLDLLRGTALIIILIDHLELAFEKSVLSQFTLRRYGLADGLDVFVFISGILFGLVHRRVQESGFLASQLKAIQRACILLAANCIAFIFVIILCLKFPASNFSVSIAQIDKAVEQPVLAFLGVAMMSFQPFGFDILPLYAVILLIAPLILWVSRHTVFGAIAVSLLLYCLALSCKAFSFSTADGGPWPCQPLGWQLVFTMGMLVPWAALKRLPCVLRVALGAGGLCAFIALSAYATALVDYCYQIGASWLVGRSIPGPLRVLHFALLAASVSFAMAFWKNVCQSRKVQCLAILGSHSLPVYLFGIWFTYLSTFNVHQPGATGLLLLEMNGVLLSLAMSILIRRLSCRSRDGRHQGHVI